MSSTIDKKNLQKSLTTLASMANLQKAQLHHTSGDSNPGTWAGTSQQDVNESEDNVESNGTDYKEVRKSLANKVRKSLALTPAEVAIAEGRNPLPAIGAKLAKSEALTPAEQWAFKGGFDPEKGMFKGANEPSDSPGAAGEASDKGSVPDTHVGGEMPGEDVEADAKKSLRSAMGASEDLSKGLELSPFLAEFAGAIATALEGAEARITKSLMSRIDQVQANLQKGQLDQGEFNKSLAETTVGIGRLLQGQTEQVVAAAQQPAHAPKSQLRSVQGGANVSKSIGPGGMGMDLTKSQIVDTMVDLVKSNKLPANEVVKFESTGQLDDGVRQIVVQHLNAR